MYYYYLIITLFVVNCTFILSTSTTLPTYRLPGPGMYSVVLTVTDSVGNSAFARGLLLWDSQSTVTTVTQRPMSVSGVTSVSEKDDNYVWLTSPVDRHHPVIVNWQGHFENTFHITNQLLNAVKPWPATKGTRRPMLMCPGGKTRNPLAYRESHNCSYMYSPP